jgi:hypothetical protein
MPKSSITFSRRFSWVKGEESLGTHAMKLFATLPGAF